MSLLEVSNLDAGYGSFQILHEIDLAVENGEYIALIGPNGAGKSTVMKSIFGLTTYMDGTVHFDGEDITDAEPSTIIRKGIGYVPQRQNIFSSLTVEENLRMGAFILDKVPTDRKQEIFEWFPIL